MLSGTRCHCKGSVRLGPKQEGRRDTAAPCARSVATRHSLPMSHQIDLQARQRCSAVSLRGKPQLHPERSQPLQKPFNARAHEP
jgi:hypothetical protein